MSRYIADKVGFGRFSFSLSEEMGKEFRDYCVQHNLNISVVTAKIISDYLISRGIVTGQPLPTIETLKRIDDIFYNRKESD